MNNIPKKIWLQVGEECPENIDFNELAEVTWCKDKIYNNDLCYVLENKLQIKKMFIKEKNDEK